MQTTRRFRPQVPFRVCRHDYCNPAMLEKGTTIQRLQQLTKSQASHTLSSHSSLTCTQGGSHCGCVLSPVHNTWSWRRAHACTLRSTIRLMNLQVCDGRRGGWTCTVLRIC